MDAKDVVVIGVTGATRCGKGRVSAALSEELREAAVVGQDRFWCQHWRCPITGVLSDEEPQCTDMAKFAQEIQKAKEVAAASGRRFVIAEGFTLLHDASIRALLGPIHMLELSKDECIRRRSASTPPTHPPTSYFVFCFGNSRTLMGCLTARSPSVPRVGSKMPLPLYADMSTFR